MASIAIRILSFDFNPSGGNVNYNANYKAFRHYLRQWPQSRNSIFIVGSHRRIVQSNCFDFETEITAKVRKRKHKLYEMPISYYGRDFSECKKITWHDGFAAIWALIKYRFMD